MVARAWLNAMALSMRSCKSSTLHERRRAWGRDHSFGNRGLQLFMRAKTSSKELKRE
jgi:hypothetical protein